MLIHKT